MPIDLERAYAALRPGQVGAIKTVVDRQRDGQSYSSVILPTRYGKTDVARVILAYCIEHGLVSAGLFLTVNEYLRGQAVKPDKWQECWRRCGISVPMLARELRFPEARPERNGERFLASTIQLVQQNLDTFCLWTESVWYATGKPVLVFVDECHTGSQKNSWGQAAKKLAEHHARIVLLTATAIRSDGEKIEGFDWVDISSEPASWNTWRQSADPEKVIVDFWEGERKKIRLKADWETTFRDAWRESPSPLCKLSRVPFDVDLMTIQDGLTEKERVGLLSEKSAAEARKVMGRIVRDVRVIREGVSRLIRELRLFRQVEPTIGGIVFCGNDTEAGGEHVNDHVKAIVREIERQAPDLTCMVATMNQGDEASKIVQRFTDANVGDILIVKQMASVGMDAPRLKVCLDLSPVRQDASCLQRWFRVGTPFGRFNVAVLIHIDDCMGRALFQAWIHEQGGSQDHLSGDISRSIEVPRKRRPDDDRVTLVSGTGPADFEDTHLNRAAAELQGPAYLLCQRFPILLTEYSHAEIAEQTRGMRFDEEEAVSDASITNLTAVIEGEQDDIGLILEDIMRVRYPASRPYDRGEYGATKQELWGELYREADISYPKGGLRHITDRSTLARMKAAAELMRSREVDDGEPPY
jgi:hypothetical protein